MATILDDVSTSANWIAQAPKSFGLSCRFHIAEFAEIDRFFDEHSSNGLAKPNRLLANDLGQRIFAVGSYIGEVARLELGGKWSGNDSDAQAEINVELHLPDDLRCWPVQRAMKRFKNGPEDAIAAWGAGLGLHVDSPSKPRKSLFKKLFG